MDVLCFILAASSGALFLLHHELDVGIRRSVRVLHGSIAGLLFVLAILELLRIQEFWTTYIFSSVIVAGLVLTSVCLLAFKYYGLSQSNHSILYAMIALAGAVLPWIEKAIFILFGLLCLLFVRVLFYFRKTAFESVHRRKWLFTACMGLLVIIGFSLAAVEHQNTRYHEMQDDLLRHSRVIANALSFQELEKLQFSRQDAQNPVYLRLSQQLRDFARVSKYKTIYTIARRNGKFLFGPESLVPGDSLSSPPGTEYFQPPFSLYLAFLTGLPLTTGPYTDEYGTFVSAFVPIVSEKTRQIRLVVGMDIQTPQWNLELARARLAPLGFGFFCLVLIFLMQRIVRIDPEKAFHHSFFIVRHTHAFLVLLLGLIVTAYVALSFSHKELNAHQVAFQEGAMQRAFWVHKLFNSVEQNELRALSRFFRSSDQIMPHEFQVFTHYVVTRPHVYAAMYAARVPTSNRQKFEEQIRANFHRDYHIYPTTEPSGQAYSYPVFMMEPMQDKQVFLGYDLNSNVAIREALEFAQETQSTALSDAFALPLENGQEVMVSALIRPMPSLNTLAEKTFAVLFVRHDPLLESAMEKMYPSFQERQERQLLILDLYQTHNGRNVFLATTRLLREKEKAPTLDSLLATTQPLPILAFGKTYLLFCSKGVLFDQMHPRQMGRFVAYAGTALSFVLSLLVGFIRFGQRRLKWELERQRRGWKSSEEKFHQLVEKSPLAIVVLLRGRIQYANSAALQLLKCSAVQDLFDEAFLGFLPEKLQKRFEELIEKPDHNTEPVAMDLVVCEQNIPCEMQFVRISLGQETGILLFIRNLTAQIQAQQENMKLQLELEKSKKIESISRLANGVSHDFNNMLGVILGATDILLQQMPSEDPNRQEILEIQVAAGRAADLVRRLLQFSRRQDGASVLLDINRRIKMELPILTAPFSTRINVCWEPAETLWLVRIDPEQFSQVLSILIKNACEAIEDQGTVTIKTFNVVRPAPGVKQVSEFVVLSVSDTGRGMDTAILDHLFEPFFTTKKPEEHSGLGLALLHAIVMQNGGFIETQTCVGQGSTFLVHFPKAMTLKGRGGETDWPLLSNPQERKLPPIVGGPINVLYVDDEDAHLRIAVRLLEKVGFVVYVASNAQKAMRCIESEIRMLHVVVCDVALPDMSVLEFVRILKDKFPTIRVLMTSGYSYNSLIEQGRMTQEYDFLAKPFSGDALVHAIQRLVGEWTP